jgi:hypothetical protein
MVDFFRVAQGLACEDLQAEFRSLFGVVVANLNVNTCFPVEELAAAWVVEKPQAMAFDKLHYLSVPDGFLLLGVDGHGVASG